VKIHTFIVTDAYISAEYVRANVVLDSRSIRARKPLFYANLTALVASNKLFARSGPFMGDTERFVIREKRGPSPPLYSLSVLFVARGVVNTTKCLPLIKPVATDKYLSDVMDPPTNTLRRTRSALESKTGKEIRRAYFLSVKGSTRDVT